MKYICRTQVEEIIKLLTGIPIITITGPRQSGKTTMVKNMVPNYKYYNLEEPESYSYAKNDPKGFLQSIGSKVILDEVQNIPELFSYLQVSVDTIGENGMYILTGSNNFQLLESITQSLAGRTIIFHLLPFSINELAVNQIENLDQIIHKGFYPRIHSNDLDYYAWYASYIQTYIERDLRKIQNIGDLNLFRSFVRICAGRVGQLLNFNQISNEIGVSYHTIQRWLSALEASYIVYRLPPFYKNLNKRLSKSSKLYFYDSGLLCYLLGIKNSNDLEMHYLKGGIFESFVISELKKVNYNRNKHADFWFFRDSNGNEVDLLMELNGNLHIFEIKSGKTIHQSFLKGLDYWRKLNDQPLSKYYVIYGGDNEQVRNGSKIMSWKSLSLTFNG